MKFCQSMKVLAPYNSMLAYIQRPGAKYLLNDGKWKKLFGRAIKPDARPILVLIPLAHWSIFSMLLTPLRRLTASLTMKKLKRS